MELAVGEQYEVMVTNLIPIGAVVTIGSDPDTYLIHVSNIANTFVKDPALFLSVGITYMAEGVVGKVKPVELSLKGLDLKPEAIKSTYSSTRPPKDPPKIPEFKAYQPGMHSQANSVDKDFFDSNRPTRRPQSKKPYGNKRRNRNEYYD